jgi:hypothetical protein
MNMSIRSSCLPSSAHPSLSLVERSVDVSPSKQHFGRTNPNAWSGKRPDTLQRYIHTALPIPPSRNHFRHFPQTKPTSANEANGESVMKTMFEDERGNLRK